jgi:hypothetical protein
MQAARNTISKVGLTEQFPISITVGISGGQRYQPWGICKRQRIKTNVRPCKRMCFGTNGQEDFNTDGALLYRVHGKGKALITSD